jgi:hypothetical protein
MEVSSFSSTARFPFRARFEASSDLLNWTELDTQTFPATFTDFDAAIFPQRFYRARIGP